MSLKYEPSSEPLHISGHPQPEVRTKQTRSLKVRARETRCLQMTERGHSLKLTERGYSGHEDVCGFADDSRRPLSSDNVFQETSARYRAVEPKSGSNAIPRRARPGLAGLRPHTRGQTLNPKPEVRTTENLSLKLRPVSQS